MTPEQMRFRAGDAKAVVESPIYKEAWKNISDYVESRAIACDPDNREMCQRIVITKQIMAALEREFRRVIEEGTIAEIRIAEIEKKRFPIPFRR